jgi:hypothetical protein
LCETEVHPPPPLFIVGGNDTEGSHSK